MRKTLKELGFKVRETDLDGRHSVELRLIDGDLVGSCTAQFRLSNGEAVRSMHVVIYEREELSKEQLSYLHKWEERQRSYPLPKPE